MLTTETAMLSFQDGEEVDLLNSSLYSKFTPKHDRQLRRVNFLLSLSRYIN